MLLHTSDWHLGRSLHGVDLLEHHAAYLDHLVELVRERDVDAVLVSGDVYDRAVPPVDAVRLLSGTLRRLAELTHVVLTSGNHDSAARLGFGSDLMRPEIHLVTRLDQVGEAVPISEKNGPGALVYPLPFLDVDVARGPLSPTEEPLPRSHEAVLGAAMDRVRADLERRGAQPGTGARPAVVVMAHGFVVGGQPSESERDIRVGGVDNVPLGIFQGADYLALGHLHGPQLVSATGPGDPVARYAGSPLAFSFSEMNHHKSTALVHIDAGEIAVELVPAPVPRPMGEATGTLEEVLAGATPDLSESWMRITVTDAVRPQHLNQQVKKAFPHALVIQHLPAARSGDTGPGAVTAARDPLEVAAEFTEFAGGAEPTPQEKAALVAGLEAVRRAEGSA